MWQTKCQTETCILTVISVSKYYLRHPYLDIHFEMGANGTS